MARLSVGAFDGLAKLTAFTLVTVPSAVTL